MNSIITSDNDIIHKLKSLKTLPTIPKVILEVGQLLRDPSHNSSELCKVISKDQSLTTKILSISNSPLFGLPRKVSSLDLAILLIGEEELSNIVIALSMVEAIKLDNIEGFSFPDYWKHSMMMAALSRDLAKKLQLKDMIGDAFIGGILHDLGIQIIAKYFPDLFVKTYKMQSESGISFLAAEASLFKCTHQEVGSFLAQKWSLPPSLCEAMGAHHSLGGKPENIKLVSIIHLADYIIEKLQMGNVVWDKGIVLEPIAQKALGIDSHEKVNQLLEESKEQLPVYAGSLIMI